MNKILKRVLITSSALLMLVGVGASTNNTNINARHRRTHKVYHASWHKGAPKVIQSNYYWYSNQSFKTHQKQIPSYHNVIWFQHDQVEMATENYYRWGYKSQGRGWLMSNGLGEWWNPHYKYVGRNTYKLNAGDDSHYTIKVHNYRHVSVWLGKQYMGYFHRGTHIPKD